MPGQFKFLSVESPWITSPLFTTATQKGHASRVAHHSHTTANRNVLYVFFLRLTHSAAARSMTQMASQWCHWTLRGGGLSHHGGSAAVSPCSPVPSWVSVAYRSLHLTEREIKRSQGRQRVTGQRRVEWVQLPANRSWFRFPHDIHDLPVSILLILE